MINIFYVLFYIYIYSKLIFIIIMDNKNIQNDFSISK